MYETVARRSLTAQLDLDRLREQIRAGRAVVLGSNIVVPQSMEEPQASLSTSSRKKPVRWFWSWRSTGKQEALLLNPIL